MTQTRIVLVHAVTVAIDRTAAPFAERWPRADLVNLLDDSLSRGEALEPALALAMHARFETLTRYAIEIGARPDPGRARSAETAHGRVNGRHGRSAAPRVDR